MFSLRSFANISGNDFSLLVPTFSLPDQNVPFVQIMDRNYSIKGIVPYYNFDDVKMLFVEEDIQIDVGSKGIVAFSLSNDEVVFGDIDFIRNWVRHNYSRIEKSPLLQIQLIKMMQYPIGEKYAELSKISKQLFVDRPNLARAWLEAELVLLQKHSQIWNAIERLENVDVGWVDPIASGSEADKERLVRWLSAGRNFDNPYWSKTWFYAEKLAGGLGRDERLLLIAIRWLQYLVGSGGDSIVRGSNILNRTLLFVRDDAHYDELAELLAELFESGAIFDRELRVSLFNIEVAIEQIRKVLSTDYSIVLFARLLTEHPLYEAEASLLLLVLASRARNFAKEDPPEEAAKRVVAAISEPFFQSPNVLRFIENLEFRTDLMVVREVREALAAHFGIDHLHLESRIEALLGFRAHRKPRRTS
jgi:hypothetical protein